MTNIHDVPDRDDLQERFAQFERLVERAAPPPANPVRCCCDRCSYGPRYIGSDPDTGRPAA